MGGRGSKDESLRCENLGSELPKDRTDGNFVKLMKFSVTRLHHIPQCCPRIEPTEISSS